MNAEYAGFFDIGMVDRNEEMQSLFMEQWLW